MAEEIVYSNPQVQEILAGSLSVYEMANGTGNGNGIGMGTGSGNVIGSTLADRTSSAPAISGINELDIAQSHHYVIQLAGFTHYRTPENSFTKFLPVKSINLNYTNYESASIPVAIFGDFPLLNRKKMTSLSLTCFDLDDNKLERELMEWEKQCFPKDRYVAYIEDIARELIYRGYDVKGKQTIEKRVYVIPSGGVTVSRDYSANDAKLINFSVIAVGNGNSSATGSGENISWAEPGAGALTPESSYLDARVTGSSVGYNS